MGKVLQPPRAKSYECKKTTCGKQWNQRIVPLYDTKKIKIIGYAKSKDPLNCTRCKSVNWKIARN